MSDKLKAPWSIKDDNGVTCFIKDRNDNTIAEVRTGHTIAQAKLIKSAPLLLDALDALFGADMVHCMMGDGKPDQIEAINKAIEAYEQATGIKRAEKIEVDDE